MKHFTWLASRSLFGALVGLALLSACTNTELALGPNDAANPRATSTPLPALTRSSLSPDAQPAASPMAEGHAATQHDMPAGMKMDSDMEPMDPHAAHHSGHTGTMGDAAKNEPAAAQKKTAHWTCTMHPNVDVPEPGKCPICGMKLVPKADTTIDGGAK